MATLANSEEPDKMPHKLVCYHCQHCFPKMKIILGDINTSLSRNFDI